MISTLKVIFWWCGIGAAAVVVLGVIALIEAGFTLAKATHPVIILMWCYIAYGIVAYTLLITFAPFRWLARHIQP